VIAALLLPLLLIELDQVGRSERTMTVDEVQQHHVALTGKRVTVEGRLAECQPLSCGLLGDGSISGVSEWLSFESSPAFDRAAAPFVGHRVLAEGVVLDFPQPGERDANGSMYLPCFDRCSEFRPTRIVRILDSEKSPN